MRIDYPGTKLTWALWSYLWQPQGSGDYVLRVRAIDGNGAAQEQDEKRPFTSGITGFHEVRMHVIG